MKKRSLAIAALVGVTSLYFIYSWTKGGMNGGMPDGMPVSVAEVTEKRITEWSEFAGRLRAVDDVSVVPRVSGTIDAIHFRDGDKVLAGDKLFTIDPRPYRAAYNQAKARADYLGMEAQRAGKVFSDKAISKRELDEKVSAAKEAQAALDLATLNLEYADVTAPVSGKVGRAEITVGNVVQAGPGAPVLTTIQSVSPIYADFEIDEQTYLALSKTMRDSNSGIATIPVYLALANETTFTHKGEIRSFDNQLGAGSGTLRVRASFPNEDGSLIPGLFAHIRMGGAQEVNAVLVNEAAIGTDQNKKFVFVVNGEGMSEYRQVKLGSRHENMRVVREGLKPGERIVVNGLLRVQPGAKLMPQMVSMDTLKPAEAPAAAPAAP